MSAFSRAAYIVSARHRNGSVVCKAADALPFLLREGQTVHFVPPTLRGVRSTRVLSIKDMPSEGWEVAFEGVESIDAAEALAGSYCLVAEDELPDIGVADDVAVLQGFSVHDLVHGELGSVVAVHVNPAQATLEIEGPYGQVLIPFVDEFVSHVDEDARTMQTNIPESLLVLNASTQAPDASVEGGEA